MYRIFKKIKIMDKLDLYEDEIVDIIECEEEETVDILMKGKNKLFFANNILTHNSGYDSTDITMKDIAESAGLSHTADVMYGIIQDSTMHINEEYWLKILKMRDGAGKNYKCKYKIDYKFMRLYETSEMITGDVQS